MGGGGSSYIEGMDFKYLNNRLCNKLFLLIKSIRWTDNLSNTSKKHFQRSLGDSDAIYYHGDTL